MHGNLSSIYRTPLADGLAELSQLQFNMNYNVELLVATRIISKSFELPRQNLLAEYIISTTQQGIFFLLKDTKHLLHARATFVAYIQTNLDEHKL